MGIADADTERGKRVAKDEKTGGAGRNIGWKTIRTFGYGEGGMQ